MNTSRDASIWAALLLSPCHVLHGAESEAPVDVDEVVVTGSRIRGVEAVGSNVVSLDREVITQSPGKTAMEVVSTLPQLLNFGVNEQTLTSSAGTTNVTRSSSINLHGINQAATLVLLNGRRGPPMGTNGGFTDPSYIPTIAIERVEVIADGASAIYGADAVAGVVNFMTRRNFDGVEVRARQGWADGYNSEQYGAIVGQKWSTGHVMAAFEHIENGALSGAERDFVRSDLRAEGGIDYRPSTCLPGNIVVGNVSYAVPVGGVTPATANQLVPGTRNLCETFRNLDLLPQQNRDSAHVYLAQDVGENFEVFVEGFWSQKDFSQRHTTSGSSTQLATLTVPSTNAFFVRPPGTTGPVRVEHDFRQDFGGLYYASGYVRTYGGTIGATWDLGSSWQAELTATHGKDRDYFRTPVINAAALATALASSDPASAFNPFVPGSSSPAVIASLTDGIFQPEGVNRLKLYELRSDGALFDLPGGEVRLALGASYQNVGTWSATYRGTTTSATGPITVAERNIRSAYAELFVPIVGTENALPAVQRLDLSLAGRIDDYSDLGETTNPKFGITWEAVPGFTTRASYGTSFRAPNLADLSLARPGTGALFTTFPDPLSPTGSSTGINYATGNPDLKPETATSYSLGVQLEPVSLDGASFAATYWKLDFKNQVLGLAAVNTVLSDPAYADRVQRNPSEAFIEQLLNSGIAVTGVRPPVIAYAIDGRPRNQGATRASGLDVEAHYQLRTERLGAFSFGVAGTRFLQFDTKLNRPDPFADRINTVNFPAKLRARATLGWQQGDWSAALYANHTGSYRNTGVTPVETIDSYTTFDAHVDYTLPIMEWVGRANLAFSASNLFDDDPPFVNVQGGYDPVQASLVGRLLSVTVELRW
jgi:iron complex outermembrane recepter protein